MIINLKQKRHRIHRDALIENTSKQLHALLKNRPLEPINFRELFESGLFGLAMKQVSLLFNCSRIISSELVIFLMEVRENDQ